MMLKTISFIILLYVYPLWWGIYSDLVEACLNRLFSYCEILGVHPYILDSGPVYLFPLPVQDGWVKGHELISSYESSKVTTNSWTTTNRRTLEPTKKRYPTFKTKKKPQWDRRRGKITIIKSHIHLVGDSQIEEQ